MKSTCPREVLTLQQPTCYLLFGSSAYLVRTSVSLFLFSTLNCFLLVLTLSFLLSSVLMAPQTSFSPSSSSSCSFSSSSFSYAWKYHVFLSFRGADTRLGFIGHLHQALSDKGIRTFIDDEELRRGEEIKPSLVKAIEESRIAIPVFSKSYASSSFCLDELVKIMECVKGKGRLVLPVFYDVDPRDVRHQSGCYKEALAGLEERFKDDKERVQKWREALHQAANLSGEHFKPGIEYECDLIVKIVKEISERISRVPLYVADYPVGLESRVLEVNRLLNDGFECGIHMVGIIGIGGIGKTTLAKAVYNSVADQFESLCFIGNMRELSDKHGLAYLQQMVLSKILGDKVCNLGSVDEGISIIKDRLCCMKVLLVLDDVDKRDQLQVIIGGLRGSRSRSRVIITTRDKSLLTTHEVKKAYEVGVLNEEEAVELFSWKAFKSEKVEPCYMDILKKLVTYASGLPLALELIGSSLFGRCVNEWKSALDMYKKGPHEDVQRTLKVSIDALNPRERNIFLDIACCFKGYELVEVKRILHAHYGFDQTFNISMLVDKSLLKIINYGFCDQDVITLHDLIQDCGREIVHSESPDEPAKRSRLWLAKDIVEVLQNDEGTSKIQLISLGCDYNGDVIEWDGQAFRKMKKLRTLIIGKCRFSQGPKYLPSSLRVLKWETHPLQEYQPFHFHPKHLDLLDLSRSCFDSVQLIYLLKNKFENMSVLKFDGCGQITKIPNLSSAPKLEELSFADCDNLTEIDGSVGYLDKLKTLDASGCSQLRSLPPLMLPSLTDLRVNSCSSLESFPEILGKMERMTSLRLYYVPIKKFPYSIHNLTGLRELFMFRGGFVELPSSIMLLEQVETIRFNGCEGLLLRNEDEGEEQVSSMSFSNKTELCIADCNISEEFFRIAIPLSPRLEFLRLYSVNFRFLPKYIEEFQFLRKLHLFRCEKLEEIRGIPPNIEKLFVIGCTSWRLLTGRMLLNKKLHEEGQDRMFILPWNRLPTWFEYRRRESSITFWFRNKFPAISFGFFFPSVHTGELVFDPQLTINGAKSFDLGVNDRGMRTTRDGLVFISDKTQTTFRDEVDEVLSENEWNCAVFSVQRSCNGEWSLNLIEIGVHIIKEKSCMDDVRFINPLLQKECGYTLRDMGDYQTHAQLVQQQQQQQPNSAPREWQVGQGTELLSWPPPPSTFNDNVTGNSNSKRMSSTTTTVNVQDFELDRGAVLNPVESFDDVYDSSNSNSDSKPQSLVGSDVEEPLDDAYNNSFSNKTELDIYGCKLLEEFLRIVLPMSPRLQSLCLRSTEFSIVPECIGEFQLLRSLKLIDCKKLEEIRGIPPNIEELFVVKCKSLSAWTREMLLNQKLHEEGQDRMVIIPEPAERLPMWFEYRRRDLSIAFWFRNKFPAISFGLFTRRNPLEQSTIRPRLTINGVKSFQLVAHDYEFLDTPKRVGHILIFSKTQTTFRDQVGEVLSENEWKRAVIDVYDDEPFNEDELDSVQVGIHIIKEKSCMDDIRFTDPLSQNQCDTLRDGGYSHEAHTQFVQQQTYSAQFLEWQCDTVKFVSNSKDKSSYTTNLNVQDLQEEQNFHFWYIQEEQNLTSINQHNLEGCESFGAGSGKNPLTELLSTIKQEQLVMLDLSRNCSNSVQVVKLLKKKFENIRLLRFDYCKHITKIPNLSSAPKLEVLSFVCCHELTEIDESVGSLDKLKTLDAFSCSKLRSLPPLMLPSLKYLNLKLCSSLESFPEILGKMECVTRLSLSSNRIKKLPYSIHNLTGLQSLSLRSFRAVGLPNGMMLPGVERLSFNFCDDLLLPNQDEGEEQVSSMPFSNAACLRIYGCNISEEFLRIALPMFPRLQFLCLGLGGENFRILPECIGEFQFLRRLILIDCEKLEEIRGIPPNIEELSVTSCRSLSSSTREMLLNKKLYEEGQDKRFILGGNTLPVWFEYRGRESSITFWFRNKFPAISLGVFNSSLALFISAKLTINGTKSFQLVQYHLREEFHLTGYPHSGIGKDDLICIFSKTQTAFRDQVDEAFSGNEWNRAVFSVYSEVDWLSKRRDLGCAVEVGVHIIKESSSMDDIRFTDPLPSTFNDNVNGTSNSKRMSSTTTTLNVQGLQEEQNITSIDQHKSEGRKSVDKACNSNAREDKGKNPLTELLSTTENDGKDFDEEVSETTIAPTSISEANHKSYESSSSLEKTPAKIQKTVTIQNHDKDSEVEVVETTTVPTAVSEAKSGSCQSFIHSENVDQPVSSLIEIQPPSPQPLDPLAELDRGLLGTYDGLPESTSPAAASCSENQYKEEEQHSASINHQNPERYEMANSERNTGKHEAVITSIHEKELMHQKKRKLKEDGQESSATIASRSKNNTTQLGDKITFGEQVNDPSKPHVSDNISHNKSKQTPIVHAKPIAEATGQFSKNQAGICHTHFLERIDNDGQQSAPNAGTHTNIVESTIIEENMEAFYASLEAETSSQSHLQHNQPNTVSIKTRPNEETQKALQILRDFVSKKFSLLLHPGRSGLMKDVLKYLLSLSPEEGVSLRTKSLILKLSTNFDRWSLDYDNASLKFESATAGLSRSQKVEEELQANVKDFREAEMVDEFLCTQLASLEEKKRELEEQISVMKAEIADFRAERDRVAKRKRQVFENGKVLKGESEGLRNLVPTLKAEQEWAKVTQASIEEEWSKLGEQVIGGTSFEE